MNVQIYYAIGLSISLAISLTIVLYIRKPLFDILVDLCRTRERARFWSVNSQILMVLVPLMFALAYRPNSSADLIRVLSSQSFLALFGLVGTILAQSFIINLVRPSFDRPDKQPERAA